MEISELVNQVHQNAVDKGFWEEYYDDVQHQLSKLMLIVTEVAEAAEVVRKPSSGALAEELADIVIRVADLCGGLKIDLDHAIQEKIAYNRARPYMHGKLA